MPQAYTAPYALRSQVVAVADSARRRLELARSSENFAVTEASAGRPSAIAPPMAALSKATDTPMSLLPWVDTWKSVMPAFDRPDWTPAGSPDMPNRCSFVSMSFIWSENSVITVRSCAPIAPPTVVLHSPASFTVWP